MGFSAEMEQGLRVFVIGLILPLLCQGCSRTVQMNITADSSIGNLTSPNYPELYSDNLNCKWKISCGDRTQRVYIFLEKYDTERVVDYLSIYDDRVSDQTKIAQISGKESSRFFASNSSRVYLLFHTDSSYQKKGFWLQYACTVKFKANPCRSDPCENGGTCVQKLVGFVCACREGFKGKTCNSGCSFREELLMARQTPNNLTSPGYPDRYGSNLRCKWKITCPSQEPLYLKLRYILDGPSDAIIIYEGSKSFSDRIARLTFYDNNRFFTVKSGTAYVDFITDKYDFSDGFKMQYYCSNKTTDVCSSKPCGQYGTCFNNLVGYNCICNPGFTGTNCSVDIDDCHGRVCYNGGECVDGANHYRCKCPKGLYGRRCLQGCPYNTTLPGSWSYRDLSFAGSYDSNCSWTVVCPNHHGIAIYLEDFGSLSHYANLTVADVDVLMLNLSDPFWNSIVIKSNKVEIHLQSRHWDTRLQLKYMCTDHSNKSLCNETTCHNGGICIGNRHNYKCVCAKGYNGTECKYDVDDCLGVYCESGNCSDLVNGFECQCPAGHYGRFCHATCSGLVELKANSTETTLTAKGSNAYYDKTICVWEISCPPGRIVSIQLETLSAPYGDSYLEIFDGSFQKSDSIEKMKGAAYKRSFLTNTNITYISFQSTAGATATFDLRYNCANEICSKFPCENGGTCLGNGTNYRCNCLFGFTGQNCSKQVDMCENTPCQNGATCINTRPYDYFCTCPPGYIGEHCSEDIDKCQSTPCANGGSCINQVNSYLCSCAVGYTGLSCETAIDECASNPCLNAGSCLGKVGGYKCSCAPGFTSKFCETEINKCDSNPCKNNGTCHHVINDYNCTCLKGWKGKDCSSGSWKLTGIFLLILLSNIFAFKLWTS